MQYSRMTHSAVFAPGNETGH